MEVGSNWNCQRAARISIGIFSALAALDIDRFHAMRVPVDVDIDRNPVAADREVVEADLEVVLHGMVVVAAAADEVVAAMVGFRTAAKHFTRNRLIVNMAHLRRPSIASRWTIYLHGVVGKI